MTEKERYAERMIRAIKRIPEKRPLIHMIASSVTGALCADVISAVGGRPLMAQAPEEMEEITAAADALVVNMGQPSEEKYRASRLAMETAADAGIPVVFDPVGAGASEFRKQMAAQLAKISWSGIIKGNSAEIHTLLTGALSHSGVDSVGMYFHEPEAEKYLDILEHEGRTMVTAETGAVDKILWKESGCGKTGEIQLRHRLERPVVLVGTGCLAGALTGTILGGWKKSVLPEKPDRYDRSSFHGRPDPETLALAAAAAVSFVSYCGERQGDCGYGTYKAGLLDALSRPDWDGYREYLLENMTGSFTQTE